MIRNYSLCVTVLLSKLSCEFNTLVQINFPENLKFQSSQAATSRRLERTNLQRCEITRRLELDIGPGAAESAVEFPSTLNG